MLSVPPQDRFSVTQPPHKPAYTFPRRLATGHSLYLSILSPVGSVISDMNFSPPPFSPNCTQQRRLRNAVGGRNRKGSWEREDRQGSPAADLPGRDVSRLGPASPGNWSVHELLEEGQAHARDHVD